MRVELYRLDLGGQVSKEGGGQAPIYELDPVVARTVGWSGAIVAKLYRQPLGGAALDAFAARVRWALSLSDATRDELYRVAAWPLLVIEHQGRLAGIVMPDQRPRYGVPMQLPSGSTQRVLMSLEHILMGDGYLERRLGVRCDTETRAAIGERLATALSILHRHSVVASDISQANILVRISDTCDITFIDCDSMTFRGSSVLKVLETPGWELPAEWHEMPTTRAADAYKLGLAILRLFARNQSERDLRPVKAYVPTSLHHLTRASLSRTANLRPTAGSWQVALRAALGTSLANDFPGPPSKPAQHASPPRAQSSPLQLAATIPAPAAQGSTGLATLGVPTPQTGTSKAGVARSSGVAGQTQQTTSVPTRPAALASALRRDLWLVVIWTASLCLLLFAASVVLTFKPSGASVGTVVAAAWRYFHFGLAVASSVAFLTGALYDTLQVPRNRKSWQEDCPLWHAALVVAAPALCTWKLASSGYVPPEDWSYLVATPAIAHVGALVGRFLWSLPIGRSLALAGATVAPMASLLIAATLPPSRDSPSIAAQLLVDRSVASRTEIGDCLHVPIEGSEDLLRDSVNGEVRCRRHRYTGLFMHFRNIQLLELYASQRSARARRTNASPVSRCQEVGAAYVGGWHADTNPGTNLGVLICYQHRSTAVLEWSDNRDNTYSVVEHVGRSQVYAWWRARLGRLR